MAKKSAAKRIARLEDVAIGAGFLLQKMAARYGGDFGDGMTEQVRDCIRDCRQIGAAREQRQRLQEQQAASNAPQAPTHSQPQGVTQ